MPNQILDNQSSSKYCDKINNQIEQKNIFAVDNNWLGSSWVYYQRVINGNCNWPTL